IAVTTRDHAPYASEPLTLPEHDDCQHSAQLLRGGAVEVTVAEPDGTPVGDLRVEHVAENGHRDDRKTDATGRVTFDRLVPGAHRFRLGPRSNGPFDMPMAVAQRAAGGRAPAEAGWETSDVADGSKATLRLLRTPTASLRGIVRENGAPLAGARIAFVEGTGNGGDDADNGPQGEMFAALAEMGGRGGNSRSTKSGDDGSYQLKDLAAGEHRLRITHRERSMPAVVAVVLRTGENTFAVELDTTLLRGTVRDPHGDPVAGATITVHQAKSADAGGSADVGEIMGAVMPGMNLGGNRATVKTGADGSYELRGVQAGIRLQVRATAKGFAAAAAAPVEVARGGSRDTVDLQLAAAGRIRVTATDAGPFTAAHATFAEADPDKHVAPAFVILRNGSGTLDGLRPGRWKVEIGGASGTQGEPQFVEVTAGETANASF
ncbi:MAG TPA: carboxypeptidase regulatory-like domain-containing protein, partial [Planctomycetota bacterium]|nr:carboxypeptidase regulatory-like domain-containing protein [Planctomycetota bacterium]